MAENIQPVQTQSHQTKDPNCTCKDVDGKPVKYRIGFCPVCDIPDSSDNKLPGYKIKDEVMIITDEHLISEKIFKWEGHPFKCPVCNWIIMPDFPHCVNCKSKIIFQSDFVNKYIEDELKKRNV